MSPGRGTANGWHESSPNPNCLFLYVEGGEQRMSAFHLRGEEDKLWGNRVKRKGLPGTMIG